MKDEEFRNLSTKDLEELHKQRDERADRLAQAMCDALNGKNKPKEDGEKGKQ